MESTPFAICNFLCDYALNSSSPKSKDKSILILNGAMHISGKSPQFHFLQQIHPILSHLPIVLFCLLSQRGCHNAQGNGYSMLLSRLEVQRVQTAHRGILQCMLIYSTVHNVIFNSFRRGSDSQNYKGANVTNTPKSVFLFWQSSSLQEPLCHCFTVLKLISTTFA